MYLTVKLYLTFFIIQKLHKYMCKTSFKDYINIHIFKCLKNKLVLNYYKNKLKFYFKYFIINIFIKILFILKIYIYIIDIYYIHNAVRY